MRAKMEALSNMVVGIEPRLQAIEAKLHQQLLQTPDDVDVIWCLSENYRKRGNLTQALAGYQRLLSLDPGHVMATRLQRLLSGQVIEDSQSEVGFQPSPFVLLDDFLGEYHQQKLWAVLQKYHHHFEATKTLNKVGVGVTNDYRSSALLPVRAASAIKRWFLPLVVAQIEMAASRLGLRVFEPDNVECQIVKSGDGDYYKIHSDRGRVAPAKTRYLTYVYYFHGEPKGFSGGDLLMFDTDTAKESFNACFTRIAPINNRLLLFPSNRFHAVLPVKSLVDDWRFARFTVNGWLHSAQ